MNVFLSYSQEDKGIVDKARNILAGAGLSVFDDKVDISVGEPISSAINEALDKADEIVFFISKNTSKSEWFNRELSLAISNRFKGKNQRIIPVVLDTEADVPFFINDYLYLDLSKYKSPEEGLNILAQSLLKEARHIEPKKELSDKKLAIAVEREIFELKKLEYEELEKHKSRQLFFITLIATLFSITGVTIGALHWLVKIELNEFSWLLFALLGAASSMIGAFLYLRKEEPRKNEIINRIKDIEEKVREMEVHHEQ